MEGRGATAARDDAPHMNNRQAADAVAATPVVAAAIIAAVSAVVVAATAFAAVAIAEAAVAGALALRLPDSYLGHRQTLRTFRVHQLVFPAPSALDKT